MPSGACGCAGVWNWADRAVKLHLFRPAQRFLPTRLTLVHEAGADRGALLPVLPNDVRRLVYCSIWISSTHDCLLAHRSVCPSDLPIGHALGPHVGPQDFPLFTGELPPREVQLPVGRLDRQCSIFWRSIVVPTTESMTH